jgi:hypothetical protein
MAPSQSPIRGLRGLLYALTTVLLFPAVAAAFERIENRWKPDQAIHIEHGAVEASPAEPSWWSAQWTVEPGAGEGYVRLRNRWKPDQYLHIQRGSVEASTIEPGWWSAQWRVEPVAGEGFVRLANRWKPDHYLHIEQGSLAAGPIEEGWWSAQWALQTVEGTVASPAPTQAERLASLPASNDFYVIAHMANTPGAVDWALGRGANAVEVDLEFSAVGEPRRFYHGGFCDCACLAGGVCSSLGSNPCEANTPVVNLLTHLAGKPGLALVVIDSKAGDLAPTALADAGKEVVADLDRWLFGEGYRGQVIVGVPKVAQLDYLRAAAQAANASPNRSRYWFSIDQEGDKVASTLGALATLPTRNRAFGTGISACVPGAYHSAITRAAANERAGASALTYVWTIDKASSMVAYLQAGARGIMTNHPGRLARLAAERGMRLVSAGSGLTPASSDRVTANLGSCDCDYHPGGCAISRAAPANQACQCTYKGAWTCGGRLVACRDPRSPQCLRPDTSIQACAQGGGDCGGYQNATCDCDYSRGGCTISKAAPVTTACKCTYRGAWTCRGQVVQCKDERARECRSPGTDKASCLLGGGDCGGY